MKLGIALGGGGAKGLAHIGVLEELEDHKIRPDYVSGTSIGAIIGAIYCLQGNAKNLRKITNGIIESKEFKELKLDRFYTRGMNKFETFKRKLFEKYYFGTLLFKESILRVEIAETLFKKLFGSNTFDDLKIPFVCNSLDINSGEEIVFGSGLLYKAVWASCAIPGIFPALYENERIFIDGGTVNNIPIDPVIGIGAENIIAVYLGDIPRFEKEPNTGFAITQRALSFLKYHLDIRILKMADCVVRPDVSEHHWADFTGVDELIQKGREGVLQKIDEIRKITKFWYRIKKKLFPK